ncbi:MAG TPA: CoA-binding protein [Hyphomicrobiales bacterium]|nr:CoA-binding protein [Hyphomicrobiales bacterium]
MDHDSYPDDYIRDILAEVKTIALVGASAKRVRPSAFAMRYLLAKGYRVIPVNPGQAGKPIFGQMAYAKLADIPFPIDMVDIFRPSEAAAGIVEEALALDPLPKIIWMQLGVRHEAAARRAEAAGMKVVMNRCAKIEYGRLSGEIGWAGVNTGQLRASRPQLAGHGVQHLSMRAAPRRVKQGDRSDDQS